MQQTLFLMLGYPGAGKTTTAKIVSELTGAVHLWADSERRKRFGIPTYMHQETAELYQSLNAETDTMLKNGKSVVFDTNFNFFRDRERLRAIAQQYGVQTIVLFVTTPKDIAKRRAVDEAHLHSTRILGHMPPEHFERMAGNMEPPHDNEHALEIDGTKVTPDYIRELLHL